MSAAMANIFWRQSGTYLRGGGNSTMPPKKFPVLAPKIGPARLEYCSLLVQKNLPACPYLLTCQSFFMGL